MLGTISLLEKIVTSFTKINFMFGDGLSNFNMALDPNLRQPMNNTGYGQNNNFAPSQNNPQFYQNQQLLNQDWNKTNNGFLIMACKTIIMLL